MEGELTGRVALIGPERPEWEDVPGLVPVLIGKFHRESQTARAHYDVDSPYLLHHAPGVAEQLGCSWSWSAEDLALQTTRELAAGDVPDGVEFEFPPPARKPRLKIPDLTADVAPSVAARMAAFKFSPLVYESKEETLAAFGANADAATAALELRTKMQAMLTNQLSAALYMKMHKDVLRDLSMLGVKIRSHLKFELPKTHKAKSKLEVIRPCVCVILFSPAPAACVVCFFSEFSACARVAHAVVQVVRADDRL